MDQTVPYLAGASNEQLNFEAGENVLLKLEPTARFTKFPGDRPRPEDQAAAGALAQQRVPRGHRAAGPRHLVGQGDRRPTIGRRCWASASMRPRRRASSTPLESADLDTIFGKDGYNSPRMFRPLEKIVTIGRLGHEIFPWLMFLILIVVTLENFLANTFYKEAPPKRRRTARMRIAIEARSSRVESA